MYNQRYNAIDSIEEVKTKKPHDTLPFSHAEAAYHKAF